MTKFSVSKKSILEASLELRQEIKDAFDEYYSTGIDPTGGEIDPLFVP